MKYTTIFGSLRRLEVEQTYSFFFLASRQLRVSEFTRNPETIECVTKRETATHFALLVASRCNTIRP